MDQILQTIRQALDEMFPPQEVLMLGELLSLSFYSLILEGELIKFFTFLELTEEQQQQVDTIITEAMTAPA